MKPLSQTLRTLAEKYAEDLKRRFSDDLTAVVLFGSVARGEAHSLSDVDLLIVFKNLPKGRLQRRQFLGNPSLEMNRELEKLRKKGFYADFRTHLKTAQEGSIRTPFLYEISHDGIVLHDPAGWFKKVREEVFQRMRELGSQWKRVGKYRYLDLKPDCKPGEVFEL